VTTAITESTNPYLISLLFKSNQMSSSDSLDEDELAASSRKRAFPAGKDVSSQVVQLTSTLKVGVK